MTQCVAHEGIAADPSLRRPMQRLFAALTALCFLSGILVGSFWSHRPTALRRHVDNGATALRTSPRIAFVKVHKTGSQALQNMLLRMAVRRRMRVAFPSLDHNVHYTRYPALFRAEDVDEIQTFCRDDDGGVRRDAVDMLCYHARFDMAEFNRVIANGDVNAFYIASVREPSAQFESLYKFINISQMYQARSVDDFLARRDTLMRRHWEETKWRPSPHNPQLYDFGMNSSTTFDRSAVDEYIDRLDDWFRLVIVTERMDESLLLLKRMLKLDWTGVLLLRTNEQRSTGRQAPKKSFMSNESLAILRQWNWADYRLYERFLQRHERQLSSAYQLDTLAGHQRLHADLSELRWRRANATRRCVGSVVPPDSVSSDVGILAKKSVVWYKVSERGQQSAMCRMLLFTEESMRDHVKDMQKRRCRVDGNS